ncbi:tRNA-specific adenosine deaminase 1 [Malaya genurostris]|uniref:tRNA-specific adenosine deaminase 1 n=1 Tax=Malaya genurostris TaxID=325434 RepID=UPI0026F3A81C|nr:tRNA-specific adenosine deaminase 1 [Malaya genurostris]
MELADKISKICLEKFDSLPKTGKPNVEFEWTILSTIVKVEISDGDPKLAVVALGTGTKCLGSTELSDKGDIINDSHAEVLARRAFVRYLLNEMKKSLSNRSNVFNCCKDIGKFVLKESVSFHFFTTHSPCGDASIYARSDVLNDEPTAKRFRSTGGTSDVGTIVEHADGMTGGKLVSSADGDDLMAQHVGMIRTKPGKGIRTLSLSCSDKMARWNVLGVQGSLLMSLLDAPIYLESIVLCAGTDHNREAIERALWKRWDEEVIQETVNSPFRQNRPKIVIADNGKHFRFRKNRSVPSGSKFQPAPGGIVWCSGVDKELEVEIGGRRQGITKKILGTPAARLKISKIELFSAFVAVRNELLAFPKDNLGDGTNCSDVGMNLSSDAGTVVADCSSLRYVDAKALSRAYHEQWTRLRTRVFRIWSEKPSSLLNFTLESGALSKDRKY